MEEIQSRFIGFLHPACSYTRRKISSPSRPASVAQITSSTLESRISFFKIPNCFFVPKRNHQVYFDTLPYALYLSDWCINYCQYFGCLSFIGVYMVRYDGIVIDAVPFFEQVGVFTVADFHGSFHNHDEFFAFV